MKLWLKDFEHNISPATWEAADQLCLEGKVRNLREIEPHFWVARVDVEGGAYETEVIITPHKIKAYACECFTPGRRLMCVHIAASLLKIRQFLDQRAEDRRAKAEAAQSNTLSRLSVQAVLANAAPSDVDAFVREYARRDRDFALALKTWFAGSVVESENPYILVLESVFPKAMPAKGYRDPEFRRIRKALDGLEVQLEMAASDGNYRGIFQVASAILKKTTPVVERLEGNRREALLHFCQIAFQKMAELTSSHLSVELREAAWQLIFDLGEQGLFPVEMHREAIKFLSESTRSEDKAAIVRALFDSTQHPVPGFLLQLFLASLAVKDMPSAVPKVLEDYADAPETVREAILQLYYLQHWEATLEAGEFFLEKYPAGAKYRREVEDILLFVAEKSGDKKRMISLLRQKFMQTGNLEAFRKMKDASGKNWPKDYQRMVNDMILKGDINMLAAALAAEDHLDELAQVLEREGTIALMQRYAPYFVGERQPFIRERYVALLSQYLDEHFGAPAAVFVRHRLAELAQKGRLDLVTQIAKDLLSRYSDRASLPEELAELLPKNQRKNLLTTH